MMKPTKKDAFAAIKRRLLIILLAPLVVGGLAGYWFYERVEDKYAASVSLYVLDTAVADAFAGDCEALFARLPIEAETAGRLGAESMDDLASLSAKSLRGTHIVEVMATGRDPGACADAANVASEIFKGYIKEVMGAERVSILQPAGMPLAPSGPPRLRNTLLAVAASLLVTVAVVLLTGLSSARFTDARQVEEGLGKPLLGSVNDYRSKLTAYTEREGATMRMLYDYVGETTREGVRDVAMNIGFAAVDQPIQVIAVTGAVSGDDKSSLAVMLASAYAAEGKLTLLIDADFRRPSVGKLLKQRNKLDMLDYIAGRATLEEIVVPTDSENLFFIDSGHAMALLPGLVRSDGFDWFLAVARSKYDMVIFDAPAADASDDAAVLAAKLDGMVMVVQEGKAGMRQTADAVARMDAGGASVLGVVVNYARRLAHPSGGDNDKGYYSESDEAEE